MRIGLGVVVLVDLLIRGFGLLAMYSEAGVLPRADRIAIYGSSWAYSVYDLVAGSPTALALAFLVVAIAGAALVVGVWTRVATVVCLVSAIGLQIRMPLVVTGGDVLLAAMLLWSLFLPMDARYSLAARRRGTPPAGVSNLASFALMLQVAVVFAFAGGAKLYDAAWRAGDGVYYALTAEFYTTSLASGFVTAAPGWLLAFLTFAVIGYELLCPLLLLIPRRVALWRGVFVGATILMNLSFWFCLRIGIFSWVAVIACVGLLPGQVWDWLEAKLGRVVVTGEDFGRPAAPVLPVLVALITLMMVNNMHLPRAVGLGKPVATVSRYIGLAQRGWPMFSPTARDQGWFVLLARTDGGRMIDLYRNGAEPKRERPARISDEFETYRWRKYYMNLKRGNRRAARLLLRYECRTWNSSHSDTGRVSGISLVYMRDVTLANNKRSPVQRVVLASLTCPSL